MPERTLRDAALRPSRLGALAPKTLLIELDGAVLSGGWADSPVLADKVDNHGRRLHLLLEPEDNLGDRSKESHSRGHLIRRDVDRHELVAILHAEHDGAGDVIGESEGLVVNVLRVRVDTGLGPALDVVRLPSSNILGSSGARDLGYRAILVSHSETMPK